MKKILPILFFTLLLLLTGFARAQKNGIVQTHAFFRKSTAGTIPVDESGRPTTKGITKDHLIYVQTKGSTLPVWLTAYIDGLPYSLRAVEVKQSSLNVGKLKEQQAPVILKKGKGNRLWQMVLTPQQNSEAKSVSNTTSPPVILAGTFRGKAFTYRITKMQELAKQFNP